VISRRRIHTGQLLENLVEEYKADKRGLTPTQFCVLVCLASFTNSQTGACYPSAETLMEAAGVGSKETIYNAIYAAELRGWLTKHRRPHTSNSYTWSPDLTGRTTDVPKPTQIEKEQKKNKIVGGLAYDRRTLTGPDSLADRFPALRRLYPETPWALERLDGLAEKATRSPSWESEYRAKLLVAVGCWQQHLLVAVAEEKPVAEVSQCAELVTTLHDRLQTM
jgi:helix-turn-helix protein